MIIRSILQELRLQKDRKRTCFTVPLYQISYLIVKKKLVNEKNVPSAQKLQEGLSGRMYSPCPSTPDTFSQLRRTYRDQKGDGPASKQEGAYTEMPGIGPERPLTSLASSARLGCAATLLIDYMQVR
jgi:hypothetical protein